MENKLLVDNTVGDNKLARLFSTKLSRLRPERCAKSSSISTAGRQMYFGFVIVSITN